jgi:hypothetical protein
MGSHFLATEELEVAARRLPGLVPDSSALVVWVSILDGHDQFHQAHRDDPDRTGDREGLFQRLNRWVVVDAFHGRIVRDHNRQLYKDAVVATFAEREVGHDLPVVAARLDVRQYLAGPRPGFRGPLAEPFPKNGGQFEPLTGRQSLPDRPELSLRQHAAHREARLPHLG